MGQPTSTFYNEFDPFAAAWLRGLIKGGKISRGIVDDRDFRKLRPADVAGHDRCHFFAGIGGWEEALRLAGWPTEWPVWTASLPCQPFSTAGQRRGTEDERHLFPDFAQLVEKCRPAVVFGEQVASKDGKVWLCGVRTKMETLGYSVGAADLCAAGVGAPHIRQRLFWVATSRMGNTTSERSFWTAGAGGRGSSRSSGRSESGGLADADSKRRPRINPLLRPKAPGWDAAGFSETAGGGKPGGGNDDSWVGCADGKARRLKPGITPLAYDVPGRVGLIRGYGNAIVPQVAAEFVSAFMETLEDLK